MLALYLLDLCMVILSAELEFMCIIELAFQNVFSAYLCLAGVLMLDINSSMPGEPYICQSSIPPLPHKMAYRLVVAERLSEQLSEQLMLKYCEFEP